MREENSFLLTSYKNVPRDGRMSRRRRVGAGVVRTIFLLIVFGILGVVATAQDTVVLNIRARNPSTYQAQEIEVKSYLPKGLNRDDVLTAEELEIVYDDLKEQYMVTADVTLEPEETKTFEVEIRDIWLVDEDVLATFGQRAKEVAEKLDGQAYEIEAANILERVQKNSAEIRARQEENRIPKVSTPEHISAYRHNQVLLDVVKDDVQTLEELLQSVGSERIIKKVPRGVPPSLGAIWKTIFIIVTFVAVMSLLFFIVWTRQLRKIRESEDLENQ